MTSKYNFPTAIRDKHANEYLLLADVDSKQWIFRVRSLNRKVHVAQVNCLTNADELKLMDFRFEEDFRRIGLGSVLLSIILRAARKDF